MPFAIQQLVVSRPATRRRWKTVSTAARLATAEMVLKSVRGNRKEVMTLYRVKQFSGDIAHAYHLAAD